MNGIPTLDGVPNIRPTEQPRLQPRRPEPEPVISSEEEQAVDETAKPVSPTPLDILKSEDTFDQLASKLVGQNASLRISQDDATGRFLYLSVDKASGEIIDQWPAEDFIRQLAFFLELNPDKNIQSGQALDEEV